ncbi:MAG: transcription termination factor NusA [Christensenellaceae bacterium]|jgi:N utilization substance protein A|nr:transcription termination factor NusA [Christensenellaceae bacterium]
MQSKEFFSALDAMALEKGLTTEEIVKDLEEALAPAMKKVSGEAKNMRVELDAEKGTIRLFSYQTVVEDYYDEMDFDKEITLEDAQRVRKDAKVGDVISQEENIKDFGRVAAITVKQVLQQKGRERVRNATMAEISAHEDKIVTAMVRKQDGEKYYLEIPESKIEGVLDERNSIKGQNFKPGDFIKVYIPTVKNMEDRSEILVSRVNPNFVRKLFELEVPEIEKGEIEIKSIAREAGYRTKIAVATEIMNLDPVGACVGAKGVRINNVLREIAPEKIDIIPWSEDPLEFVSAAISPSPVLRVEALAEEKHARVIVPNDKLSLAIGKQGMNVRLAAKLTGWRIDVKSEDKAREEDASFAYELNLGE